MPFSRQIRSNSTSVGGWLNRPVNTFPLSVRICSGTPQHAQRRRQPVTDRPGPFGRHQIRALTQSREWSSTPVNAFEDCGPSPAGTRPPRRTATAPSARDRSHRFHFRARLSVARRPRSSPPAAAPDTPPRPTAPATPTACASSSTSRRGPQYGRDRRSSNTAASTPAGIWCGHRARPMRPIHQPLEALGLIPRQPRMQRLPRHPNLLRRLRHAQTIGNHRQHGLIPLLSHAQLPHEGRASRISRNHCQASAETVSGINRNQNVNHQAEPYIDTGAPGRIRTCDARFRKPTLYPLSYEGEPGGRAGDPVAAKDSRTASRRPR